MENNSYEALVELITKEVLKRLAAQNGTAPCAAAAKPVALLSGEQTAVPAFAKERFHFADIGSYEGDIAPFEAVFIAKLSFTELADCALGKDACKLSCAVTNAILSGKEVYLLEAGLPYKSYKRTVTNRNFYNMLEGYVNTLRGFGVKIVKEQWQGNNLERRAIEDNTADKVITERTAKELCENCTGGVVRLRCGTVITPSAKDVFNHSQIKVEFVD
ncbi:MAG: hypothetical protein IJJ41_03375 [Clostridia bacterium]|nr:hypothetical protein [Clostridia bacterium]